MNTKTKSEIYIAILIMVAILIGGLFWLSMREDTQQQEQIPVVTKTDNSNGKQNSEVVSDLNDGLSKDLTKSFLNYSEGLRQAYGNYDSLHIYIIERTENNILGHFKYKEGEEEYIIEGFTLATKVSGKWEVIFHQVNWRDSNDFPTCDTINKYNIPVKLFWPERDISC
ncbi:MAG: hypothetical protein WAV16_02545 [Candidatus Moraniibacteriota bacterium]